MGLGDDVMATGEALRLHKEMGRVVRIGAASRKPRAWSPIFENLGFIVPPDKHVPDAIQLDNYEGCRPYIWYEKCTRQQQVLRPDFRAPRGHLVFTEAEKSAAEEWIFSSIGIGPFIAVEPEVKGTFSGENKRWPWPYWTELVAKLELPVIQIATPASRALQGIEAIARTGVREALAILAKASCVVTTDGLLHHAAAALQVPAVVLWGARTNPLILGYPEHHNLTHGDDWCGSRSATCVHCQQAMAAITPQLVLEAVDGALSWNSRTA